MMLWSGHERLVAELKCFLPSERGAQQRLFDRGKGDCVLQTFPFDLHALARNCSNFGIVKFQGRYAYCR